MPTTTRPLGRTQQAVVTSLASPNTSKMSTHDLAQDWPWLTYGSVYSALQGLWKRGLVDVAGWDSTYPQRRTFALTEKGWKVAEDLGAEDHCDNCDEPIEWLDWEGLIGGPEWVHSRSKGPECKDEWGKLLGSNAEPTK